MDETTGKRGPGLDYHLCRYGGSKMLFRGPQQPVTGEYLAFLGGAETFGRFMPRCFPDMIAARSGMTAINLGAIDTGIDAYAQSPGLIDLCCGAHTTIVQLTGAHLMSNRMYTVDPRANHRVVRISRKLKQLYPEYTAVRPDSVRGLLTALADIDPGRLAPLREELQNAWVFRMRTLLGRITGRVILLWLADHRPFSMAEGGSICREPLFVDRAMINAVKNGADAVVEIVATPEEIAAGRDALVFGPEDALAAATMLGQPVHERAAEFLTDVIGPPLHGDPVDGSIWATPGTEAPETMIDPVASPAAIAPRRRGFLSHRA